MPQAKNTFLHYLREPPSTQHPAPNTAGRGKLTSYALEKSSVELEDQFVMMMQAQRSYQANARVVNAANDTLQELVNIV